MPYYRSKNRSHSGYRRRNAPSMFGAKRQYRSSKAPVTSVVSSYSRRTAVGGVRIRETERIGQYNGSMQINLTGAEATFVPTGGNVDSGGFHMFDLNGGLTPPTATDASVMSGDKGMIINPSIYATFPWLSSIAQLYEKYKVNKLTLRYRTTQSTGVAGNIVMAFDHDVHNAINDSYINNDKETYSSQLAKAALQKLTQTSNYIDGSIWKNFVLDIKCPNKVFYTRDLSSGQFQGNAQQGYTDQADYDMGRFYLGYEGVSPPLNSVVNLGILELEYDITFMNRRAAIPPVKDANA